TRSVATRSVFVPPGHSAEEELCDRLAAAILMPKDQTRAQCLSFASLPQAILAVSREFAVSLSAAARRVKQLIGPFDFAVMLARVEDDCTRMSQVLCNFDRGPFWG